MDGTFVFTVQNSILLPTKAAVYVKALYQNLAYHVRKALQPYL